MGAQKKGSESFFAVSSHRGGKAIAAKNDSDPFFRDGRSRVHSSLQERGLPYSIMKCAWPAVPALQNQLAMIQAIEHWMAGQRDALDQLATHQALFADELAQSRSAQIGRASCRERV